MRKAISNQRSAISRKCRLLTAGRSGPGGGGSGLSGIGLAGLMVVLLSVGGPTLSQGVPAAGDGAFEKEGCIIYALREVVVSSRATGVIVAMPVEEQDEVKAGQVIAQLDDVLARLAVERLRLAVAEEQTLQEAQIRLEQAKDDYEAARKLTGTLAAAEVRSAERKYDLARVIVERAKYQKALVQLELRQAEERLSQRQVCAPIDGVILTKHREVGESVDEDTHTPVVTLIDVSKLRAEVLVPVERIADIRLGQRATVTCNVFPGRTIEGQVVFKEPVVHPDVDQFKVKVEFEDPTDAVRPGMRATVRILLPAKTAKHPAAD